MDVLVPNPVNCGKFEPNAFKKEKCKNCGRVWTEHKGVISEDYVKKYAKEKQAVADVKAQKEIEAKEKARAKAIAKKKQAIGLEDEWFFDGAKDDVANIDSDSDNDLGFQMFDIHQLDSAPIEKPRNCPGANAHKPLKIVNLIDFGECNIPDEPMDMDRSLNQKPIHMAGYANQSNTMPASSSMLIPNLSTVQALGDNLAKGAPSHSRCFDAPDTAFSSLLPVDRHELALPTTSSVQSSGPGPQTSQQQPRHEEAGHPEDLISEIQYLRQLLSDANETKSIEVAIVQDEVVQHQKIIDDLKRKHAQELEAAFQETQKQLTAQSSEKHEKAMRIAERERTEALALVERERGEVERFRSEAVRHSMDAEQQRKENESQRLEIERLRVEAEQFRVEAKRSRTEAEHQQMEVERQRKEIERQQTDIEQLVEQQRKEIERQQTETEQLVEQQRKEIERQQTEIEQLVEQQRKEIERQRMEIEQLHVEIEQLQESLAKAPTPEVQSAIAEPTAPVASLIVELRSVCVQTRDALGADPCTDGLVVGNATIAPNSSDIKEELRDIIGVANAAYARAQHAQSDRRQLTTRIQELKGTQSAAQALSLGANGMSKRSCPDEGPVQRQPTSDDAAQVMSRQAAVQAFKTMRLDVERQLAWINKRMRMSHQVGQGGPCGVESVGPFWHEVGSSEHAPQMQIAAEPKQEVVAF